MTKKYILEELQLETQLGGKGKLTDQRSLPVISLADFDSRKTEITDALWNAATEIGFFQVSDHGISSTDLDQIFEHTQSFFSLSRAEKAKYPLKPNGLNAGWEFKAQVRPSTRMADQKESYQVTKPHMDGVWPSAELLPGFRGYVEKFESQCWTLGMQILSCFATKLGFEQDFFSKVHDPNAAGYQSTLRMLHYLPVKDTSAAKENWRAGAHTDFDCLTLLLQRKGQDGLQVCPGREAETGEWTEVVADDHLITCNIGDMLMRWSDDKLKSTLHRVATPIEQSKLGSRYSVAFFCQANKPAVIQGPLNIYEPITAEAYLQQRIAANFSAY